jgi:hypothetical protein
MPTRRVGASLVGHQGDSHFLLHHIAVPRSRGPAHSYCLRGVPAQYCPHSSPVSCNCSDPVTSTCLSVDLAHDALLPARLGA